MIVAIFPFGFLFLFIIILGTILAISSSHWLGMWVGLEMNLMGFIPLLMYRGGIVEAESSIKYFIIQSLGSGMLMFGSLLSFQVLMTWEIMNEYILSGSVLVVLSLLLKLGIFPFHFWVPGVMAGLSWFGCLMLTTWQKIAPLFLMLCLSQTWSTSHVFYMIVFMAGFSSLIGGLGGINQTQVRAIMAYSSIGHGGWLISTIFVGENPMKIYFSIYFLISVGLFLLFWMYDCAFFGRIGISNGLEKMFSRIFIILLLLSLGGMPPFLGFISKLFSLMYLGSNGLMLLGVVLVLGSLISLYYYLSLLFSFILLSASRVILVPEFFYIPLSFNSLVTPVIFGLVWINLLGGVGVGILLSVIDFL